MSFLVSHNTMYPLLSFHSFCSVLSFVVLSLEELNRATFIFFLFPYSFISNFKFFCASPASSSETQECPLTGSYTIMGPLGPPYMTSRHKRNHVNGSHYHHSLGRQHDLLAFHNSNNEHDHISHPHDRLNSQRHRRDLLSKCTSAHKQRRRLSIGCSRYDVFEVNPQCSETGDEGTEISQISFRCYFFIFISSSHSLTPLWNLLEIRVFYGKKSSEKNIYILYTQRMMKRRKEEEVGAV